MYAGDLDAPGNEPGTSYVFVVEADADPDVLVRMASQFAFAQTAPFRVNLVRSHPECVRIEVELHHLSPAGADAIRRKIDRLTCTLSVEVVEVDTGDTTGPLEQPEQTRRGIDSQGGA